MTPYHSLLSRQNSAKRILSGLALALAMVLPFHLASADPVILGSASSFAILGGTAVTFAAPSNTVTGNVGVSPGTSITGAPANLTLTGTIHNNDAVAAQAQADATTAYGVAAGAATTTTFSGTDNQLGGQTLFGGVYKFGHGDTANLSGILTLDAQGVIGTIFIFQATSDFVTASGSSINLINGADACNIIWQVSSSATLGSGSFFNGTILALTSITLDAGVTVEGRLLAQNGLVSLINDTIINDGCEVGEGAGDHHTHVPDSGSTLLLLGSVLMGLIACRKTL